MISIEDHLNMIATEASEATLEAKLDRLSAKEKAELPAFQYNLELVRNSDGKLEWVE